MTKRFLLIFLFILTMFIGFCAVLCNAEELPEQSVNDNRATIAIQKQPTIENHKQEAKQNKWCIIVQINGKIKDTANTDAK